MWILELFGELIIDGLLWLAPRDSVWYWLAVALILCLIIGLGIYVVLGT